MHACTKFCHPSKPMARPALQWLLVMGYGTAVIQFSQRLLATTLNNCLSPAHHTTEDARNVLSHKMNFEAMNPSLCAIFGQQLTYFHYVTAIQQLFTRHLMKLASSPHTIHSGSACHIQIY